MEIYHFILIATADQLTYYNPSTMSCIFTRNLKVNLYSNTGHLGQNEN